MLLMLSDFDAFIIIFYLFYFYSALSTSRLRVRHNSNKYIIEPKALYKIHKTTV